MDEGRVLTFSVRKATPEDTAEVARIWHEAWCDGHVGHVPEGLLRFRTPDHFVPRTRERIDSMWVAESGGHVVGFVVLKHDELEQIFVDAAARGSGAAAMLLGKGEEELRRAGHRRAWLAVVAGNARARRFYARHGWEDMGAFTYRAQTTAGPFAVPSHRYEKTLAP